jgi:lipoate-protein ligase A
MRKRLFETLQVCRDQSAHAAAMNMAIDEALLENASGPVIRFYRWQSPALSFGYFVRFVDVAGYEGQRDLIRRWTGGGIVFHGEDLTYSVVIPASDAAFTESSMSIYQKIHRALADGLEEAGHRPVVAAGADCGGVTATNDSGYHCFANPVHSDVIVAGRKVAGAAQRRTRRGLLQQGSIQGIDISNDLAERFARALTEKCNEQSLGNEIIDRARALADWKYGTETWLRKH